MIRLPDIPMAGMEPCFDVFRHMAYLWTSMCASQGLLPFRPINTQDVDFVG